MRHSTLLQKPGNNKQHKYVHIKCSNSNDIHTEMHHNLQADDTAIILMEGTVANQTSLCSVSSSSSRPDANYHICCWAVGPTA